MRLVIDLDGTAEITDLATFEPHSTILQLVEIVRGPVLQPDEQLFLDGSPVSASSELQDLVILEGSRLARSPRPPAQQIDGWNVSVAAGVAAGDAVAIPDHRRLVLGRSPQADLLLETGSASWEHCTIELEEDGVRIRDAGSTNGTHVNGERIGPEGLFVEEATTVVIGGTALRIRPRLLEPTAPPPGSLKNLTPVATAPFNRPPKLGQPAMVEPLVPPSPKDVSEAQKFNLIAILAPIVMAAVLVLALGNWRFAIFALLSPIMAIGMYFEQRRRRTKNLKEEEERFTQALVVLQSEMIRDGHLETQRLHETHPDPSVILRRPRVPSTQLWAHRANEPECLAVQLGIGDTQWQPPLEMRGVIRLDDRVKEVLAQGRLIAAPVVADLSGAGVIGIAGERTGALALARNLVSQAAVTMGPADLTIGMFCDPGREEAWDWASWLPHTRQSAGDGGRWMSHQKKQSNALLRAILENPNVLPSPRMLMVLDSEVLTEGRDSPARDLLGLGREAQGSAYRAGEPSRKISGIVIASTVDQLPAACTTVVEVGADAACTVTHQDSTDPITDVILAGISLDSAAESARALARFEDPELVVPGASLPTIAKLSDLLGTEDITPELILRLWETQTDHVVPLGFGENGIYSIDLVHDGPHGVVAGTTGSGKSEILKALLASLVAHLTPEDLNLILVDFKGGAAFAAFERLPHTIGTISNLDEQLADRAIRALQAEMRRRQRLFAEAGEGIENLPAYLATNPAEPLPRILFIVDEFKELVKDFPDVLASLVSVAAIGRTLGIHMILATQQPAGVVSEAILTNSNLRIAARVQKAEDSSSVISDGSAATISRFHRGRAYIQRGQDDLELVQIAYVSAPAHTTNTQRVEARPVGIFGFIQRPEGPGTDSSGATDLDGLMEAVSQASNLAGHVAPRRVWPEALGASVPLAEYHSDALALAPGVIGAPPVGGVKNDVVHVALADDPDQQLQLPMGWNLREGNLLLMGVPGSGTSTTLTSFALSLAATFHPDELDILCLDMGSRSLAPLAELPHTAAYVGSGPNAREQQTRFLRHLRAELQRRRESSEPNRRTVILVDGFAALRDEFQDYDGQQLLDAFYRVYADGPSVGMHFAVSTTRAKAVPSAMDEVTTQRWVYRLADDYDYAALGIRGTQKPAAIPGRCVDSTAKLQMHVATPERGLVSGVAEAASRWADISPKTDVIGTFPESISADHLSGALDLSSQLHTIPVGIREDTLGIASLSLYEGEHVLIAGPARSGKSTLLLAIAEVLRSQPADARPVICGIYDRRSPLRDAELDLSAGNAEDIPALLASLRLESRQVFLLVDDVERVDDTDQALANLVGSAAPSVTIIAAGRSADLRGMFNHWTKGIRKSRAGVLLQPDVDYDGELLGAKLPRKAPVILTTGRGYLCGNGDVSLIQSAGPST